MQSVQLYTALDSKQCDADIIASGIAGFELMQRAADSVFDRIKHRQTLKPYPVVVLAGRGNNGGDGLLIAAMVKQAGYEVSVLMLTHEPMLTQDAEQARQSVQTSHVTIRQYQPPYCFDDILLIDALYGTGLNRPLSADEQVLIETINRASNCIIAVDIPSGLCADTGIVLGNAIKADETVSFITRKRGLYTADGPDYAGKREFNDLISDFPERKKNCPVLTRSLERLPTSVELLDLKRLKAGIPSRQHNSHKGDYGHCVLIGGNETMAGAIIMAAESCLRVGAGIVTVITREQHISALNSRLPEVMTACTPTQIENVLKKATVIAIGPGLGDDTWAESLWEKTRHVDVPIVVDASGLSFLAQHNDWKRPSPLLITPHPGEAGQLLQRTTAEIQSDRFRAARDLVERYQAIVILKGAGSIVASCDGISLCASGNPGMASAGMGDVLTGMVSGCLAQGLDAFLAAKLATTLHATAADEAAAVNGQMGLIATDLIPYIQKNLHL